jgi:hypothetical protein
MGKEKCRLCGAAQSYPDQVNAVVHCPLRDAPPSLATLHYVTRSCFDGGSMLS